MVGHVAGVVLDSANEVQAMRNAHKHIQRMFYGGGVFPWEVFSSTQE